MRALGEKERRTSAGWEPGRDARFWAEEQAGERARLRAFAELLAQLASISSLDELPEWERLKLEEEFLVVSTYYAAWRRKATAAARRGQGGVSRGLGKAERYARNTLLPEIHRAARRVICGLLAGDSVEEVRQEKTVSWLLLPNWAIIEIPEIEADADRASWVTDLRKLVMQQPFPFRSCRRCEKIFVPVKRQLYCSPTCTYKATEAARKDKKRTYMRTYMERRRKQQAKQGKRRGQTADRPGRTKQGRKIRPKGD